MDKNEYDAELLKITNAFKIEKNNLYMKFALSIAENSEYKIGQTICDTSRGVTLIIDNIKAGVATIPYPIYSGVCPNNKKIVQIHCTEHDKNSIVLVK